MCYVCGKSDNKIVHEIDCRYVKMIPEKNRKYFRKLQEATKEGYKQCKYCSYIRRYMKQEEDALKYGRKNGLFYFFNAQDGCLDVISKTGKWKIIVNGQKHQMWLYHKNTSGSTMGDPLVPGYHYQRVRYDSLMEYMKYLVDHDRYRESNPLYSYQKHSTNRKGTKNWKKNQRREKEIRRKQGIRYVYAILENMAQGNLAY